VILSRLCNFEQYRHPGKRSVWVLSQIQSFVAHGIVRLRENLVGTSFQNHQPRTCIPPG
jgi:hypothetical protein